VAREPVIVDSGSLEWETWPDALTEQRGGVRWKTLLSGDRTPTDTLTLGIATLTPGEVLHDHRHEQVELYLVLEGTGEVTIDGGVRAVGPGVAVFLPGGARHGIRNTAAIELRLAYVFAADSFTDVEYDFEPLS
jgi:quercetin dioxygenase-like cupin family protein